MPIKPNIVKLSATSSDILNVIRQENGGLYQSLVPIADGNIETIREIGTVFLGNQSLQNSFLNALVNRIGRVIITSKLYSNPWAEFKKGLLEYGETIEEIFVSLAEPHNYDPQVAEREVFKRVIPDVKAIFHPLNYQKFYKVTIQNEQLRQAFLSSEGVTSLITKIIEQLYSSANYDELITMKYLLSRQALQGRIYSTQIPELNATNAKSITSEIKALSNVMEFMGDRYNSARVPTYTNKSEQMLLVTANFDAIMDVEVLASAFNMDKAQFLGHKVLIDSFSFSEGEQKRLNLLFSEDLNYKAFTSAELIQLKSINCMLLDKEYFMIFDNLEYMTDAYNGQGLYYNYFYHVWKTFSVSPFANALLFSPTVNQVTSVTISPKTSTVAKGSSLQLTYKLVNESFADSTVKWSITGNKSPNTQISNYGLLEIGKDESSSEILVTVRSNFTATAKDVATITVGV